jgi:hypothetical protein
MNRTLLSLAILKTNWDTNQKDYIENFVPFVAELISRKKHTVLDDKQLSEDFKTEFGLVIPTHPTITILNRAAKRGLVQRDHNRFIPVIEKATELGFGKRSAEQQRALEKVFGELKAFALASFNRTIEDKEIEAAFISYLRDHDLDILFAAEYGSPLPEVKNPQKVRYIVARFITECSKKEPQLFKFILDITVGHALAATILYREFNNFGGKLDSVAFYFDTRFLLRLIGLEDEHRQFAAEELLRILADQKAKLGVFELTLQEVKRILDDCLDKLQKGNVDIANESRAVRYLVRHNKKASDVEQLILRLPSLLEEFHIITEPFPEYDALKKYQIDENDLFNLIVEIYSTFDPTFNKTAKEKTVRRDVDVISAIYRARKGARPNIIKDARAFFVSPNTALAYASRRFEAKANGLHFSIPCCVTDVFLGTLIWLQTPAKVQAISEMKLIADCFAALQPSDLLLKKYLQAVEVLKNDGKITNDQYYLLRTHRAAINLLEEKTLGDPEAFEGKTAEEILDDIIANIKAEERRLLQEEKERHSATAQLLEDERKKRAAVVNAIDRRADQMANAVSNVLSGLLFVVLTLSLVYRFFPELIPALAPYKNWWLFIALASGVLVLFIRLNIRATKDKLKAWLRNQISKFLKGNGT